MLSYLKDGSVPAAENTGPSSASADAAPQEYLTTAHHGKNAKQGTLILAILFAVAGVVVWFMIKKVSPAKAEAAAASEESVKIEQFLAQLNSFKSEVNGQMDTMFSRYYQASELGQIGVQELKKNPFRLEMAVPEKASPQDMTQARLLMLEGEVNRQAGRLQLWSITERGQTSCCLINDRVVYAGDTIEGFVVKQISSGRVVVERDGVQVELKMQE